MRKWIPRSSVRHKKCVLAFIPLPMSSRNEFKYYLGRLVFLFPLLVMTDRKTDCRYLSSKTSHWDAYAYDEVEAVCFIFPSLLCVIKYKWSHNLLALSSLEFYPATAPGSHQNHNNSIYFPFWKETFPDITLLTLTSDTQNQTHMHAELHFAMG